MKTWDKATVAGPAVAFLTLLSQLSTALAATTIDTANKYSYGANIGWLDWRGDTNNGAVNGEYVCSGYIYSANVGWINLGSGAPTNGIYYQNHSASDFGVNQDGLGNLRGDAWGANIGWISFESIGAPKVNLKNGKLSGYAWSANCGWISLSNAFAYVQTDTIEKGALAPDGLPIAWLLQNFGTTNVDANADPDGDGASNLQEYLAGTDPNNISDSLRITAFSAPTPGTSVLLTWTSVSSRCYNVYESTDLLSGTWFDSGLGAIEPDGATTTRLVANTNGPVRFYRVRAFRPLTP